MENSYVSLEYQLAGIQTRLPPRHWTTEDLNKWKNTWVLRFDSPIIIREALNRGNTNGMEFSMLSREWLTQYLGVYGARLFDDFHRLDECFNIPVETLNSDVWKPEDDLFIGLDDLFASPEFDELINPELGITLRPSDIEDTITDLEETCFDEYQFDFKMYDDNSTQTVDEFPAPGQDEVDGPPSKKRSNEKNFISFLHELLNDPRHSETIRWIEDKVFQVTDLSKLDEFWCNYKPSRPGVRRRDTRRAFGYHLNEAKTLKSVNIYFNHYKFIDSL